MVHICWDKINYMFYKEKFIKFDSINWEVCEEFENYNIEIKFEAAKILRVALRETRENLSDYCVGYRYNDNILGIGVSWYNLPETPVEKWYVVIEYI